MEKYIDKWATLNDHKVRYIEEGSQGGTILLIHGLGCSSLEWSENIRELAVNFHVIAADLVGFGMSDRPEDFEYTPAGQARILKELCSLLGVEKVNVVGNSYGGLVAIEFAKSYSSMVESLVLVNSAGAGVKAPLSMRLASLPIIGELVVRKTHLSCRQGFEAVMYDRTKLEEQRVDSNYAYWTINGSQYSFLRTLRGMMNLTGFIGSYIKALHQFLNTASVKTLIIWGRHDPLLPIEDAKILQGMVKGSTLKIFDNSGHAPMFESPKIFNSSIKSFLASPIKN